MRPFSVIHTAAPDLGKLVTLIAGREKAASFVDLGRRTTPNISSKSMHAFLSNLANRQTDRQTNAGKRIHSSFVGGNDCKLHSDISRSQ